MSRLSYATAFRLAAREVRSAAGRFAFVVIAVALGVGALTGVRSFSLAFRQMLHAQSRSLIAGDAAVMLRTPLTAAQTASLADLRRQGVASTEITESISMVSAASGANANPILTTLKAVDPTQYPYSGAVGTTPAGVFSQLNDHTVLASPDLLLRAGLHVGDQISVGGKNFRILGRLDSEPDELTFGFNLGPRLMLTRAGLRRTGIIQFGSQAHSRVVFHLGAGAPSLDAVESQLRTIFPHTRLDDYRTGIPTVQRGLNHATTFLGLISLMALVVGALGVGSAMHAHLQLRLDSIATMKVLGARTGDVLRVYGLQTLLLGLAGGGLGVLLSLLIVHALPGTLGLSLPALPALGFSLTPALQGLAAGVLVTLLFTLPALLSVRRVRPAAILRRHMSAEMSDQAAAAYRRARAIEALVTGGVLIFGLALLAITLMDEPWRLALRIGGFFVAGLAAGVLLLAALAWALLALLRALGRPRGNQPPRPLPVALRHGIANLYRPGNQTLAVVLALGLGVMFTLTIFLLQRALIADLQRGAPPGMSNVFLIDVPPTQQSAVLALLRSSGALTTTPELLRTTPARVENPEAQSASPSEAPSARRRGEVQLSTFPTPPADLTLVQGRWWNDTNPGFAVSRSFASERGLRLGQSLDVSVAGESAIAPVVAIYRADPQRLIARVDVIASPPTFSSLPGTINGGVRVRPGAIPALERNLYARFPTVTVVNVAEVVARIQSVVNQIAVAVRFVAFFAVLAGAIILASSIAGTRFRRMREIAVLKTFGATRGRIARIFSVEFLLLGSLAGLAGALLAAAFTAWLTRRLLDIATGLSPAPITAAVLFTALLAVAAGWLACARILNLKPLEVLRGE